MWKSESSWLNRERKKSYDEVAKIYGKKESFICEIVKKKKEVCASFVATTHTAEVMTTIHDCMISS